MRYPVIVILMSGLLFSVSLAQTEDELPPDPVDGFMTEEETLPDSIDGFITEEEIPPDSIDGFMTEEETLPDSIDGFMTEEETPPDFIDGFMTEEETFPDFVDGFVTEEEIPLEPVDDFTTEDEVLQPDEDESSESVNEYSYYEDTSHLIPYNPSAVLEALFEALQSGDGESVSYFVSSEAIDNIDIMLDVLKESLERDEELTMNRLVAAGYTSTASEIEDWSAQEYLEFTISLPIIVARYSMYEMQIGEYSLNGNNLDIPLIFVSSTGLELPFEVKLVREDNTWKVSYFMGFNSFP